MESPNEQIKRHRLNALDRCQAEAESASALGAKHEDLLRAVLGPRWRDIIQGLSQ